MGSPETGYFTFIAPPLAEPGELERERARLIGKNVVHSRFPCSDVRLEEGTVWACFVDGKGGYRWVARECKVLP